MYHKHGLTPGAPFSVRVWHVNDYLYAIYELLLTICAGEIYFSLHSVITKFGYKRRCTYHLYVAIKHGTYISLKSRSVDATNMKSIAEKVALIITSED